MDKNEIYLASEKEEVTDEKASVSEESSDSKTEISQAVNVEAPKRVSEILEMRAENRKVFKMSDGSEQAVFYAEQIHSHNSKANTFEDIDDSLEEAENHFVNRKGRFSAKFSKEKNDELFSIENGAHRITISAKKSGTKKNTTPSPLHKKHHAENGESKNKAETIVFSDAENGADYEYSVTGKGVKENIIINKKSNKYKFPFSIETNGLVCEFVEEMQTVYFKSPETDEIVFTIPAPFMIDAAGDKSTAVFYDVHELKSGKINFTVAADENWINDEKRVFPVCIDPQVNVSGSETIRTYSWNDGVMSSANEHTVGTVQDTSNETPEIIITTESVTPGCTKEEATEISLNTIINGNIECPGCEAWYKFVANTEANHPNGAQGTYTITTESCINLSGYVYDSNGYQVWCNTSYSGNNPIISAQLEYNQIYYICIREYSYNTGDFSIIVKPEVTILPPPNKVHRMYIEFDVPTLSRNPRIKSAELKFSQKNYETANWNFPNIGLYEVTDSIAVGSCTPEPANRLIDYVKTQCGGSEQGCPVSYSFDITTLIDRASHGELENPKLVLKLVDESPLITNTVTLSGSSDLCPELVINYESSYAMNSSYRTHSHEIGRFGQGSIDLQRGNLMFDAEDFAWGGNRMPVTIRHLYNSALSDCQYTANPSIELNVADFDSMRIGNGFKLNIMQSMISATFLHEAATYNGYIYTNENGEETYFKESNNVVCNSTYDQCYNLYESINDSETLYDPEKRTLTQGDDIYLFDISGRLVSITDKFKNTMSIAYENDRIVTVTDGIGRSFAFSYSGDGYLTKISAPDNTYISYEYSDGLLTNITYPDKQKAIIAYAENKPSSVTLQNADCENIYNVEYVFNGDNVVSVTEFGAEAGTFVAGATSEYIYSAASGRTMVVTTEQADEDDSEVNVTKTVYTFDDQGEVVSEYLYSEEGENKGVSGSSVGINPTSGESGMKVADNSNNFLQGHNFENYWHWYSKSNNGKQPTVNYYTDETNAKYGRRLLKLQSSSSAATEIGVCQTTTILTERDYTFSAYVRVVDAFSGTEDPGVYIRVLAEDGTILAESEHICQESSEYVRLISSFKLESEQAVVVQILLDGVGTAYVNAPQLESNPYAGAYNMLINGGCEYDNEGWYGNGMYTATDVGFSTKRAIGIQGYLNVACYADQEVKAKTARSTRETFTLSGWAKGCSLPVHDRDGVSKPTFRLRARIKYYDSYYRDYYSYEDFTADFSPCTEDWQFASVEFSKSKYRTIQSITVYCDYGYNDGSAYFDDIQLVRTGIETGLSSSDFTDDVSESDYDDSSTGSDNTAAEFEEVVDTFGNSLTETTFTDGEFGTLYRAFDFSENGNNLVSETDVNGNKTLYSVNEITSRNEEITDRLGNKTVYEYDENGNTVKLTSKDANDKDLATVAYEYDSFNNMTKIARGDGMDYVLKYNAFHNLESIGIEDKEENLVTYAYKNGNGKLKEVTYANDDTMKASYNSLGQMTAEKWYDKDGALTAHYKYVYDGQGNIVRSVDILAQKEYTYVYEDGKISRATEYDVTVNENEIITAKTVVNTIYYTYSEDKLTKKRIVPSQGDELVTYFENSDDDNTVVKFTAGGKNVTSHSKNDSFGRKVFDELQLSTGFVSRQFSYHAGAVSETHTENEKLKSSATTQLVSQIVMSDGRTIAYEYDAEERITKVVDSIEGTTEYTYDALGQLLTETTNGKAVNTMVYDSYGNILQKNGKSYVYDEVWKDRLAYYDGKPLTYDAQGNPTNYLGQTLTWEKGRQLKSFGNISYTYNANGIRTSKTVAGIRHDYLLDGTKILKETWNDDVLEMLYDNEDSVCGIVYNGKPYYFLKNLQGDIIAITNAKGETVARYSYDAWGICNILETESVNGSIANINPFRYRGYYYDEEIGMYYLQSRYYDATVARFLNSDEVAFAMLGETAITKNLFTYCSNSPIINVDENGYYTASSLKKKSWLFRLASNFGINIGCISRTIKKQFFRINLWLVKLVFSVSVGLTKNYKAGISFNFTKKSIGVSANLGMGAGYSLAFAYALSWTNVTRSMSLVYSAKNDGVYVSFDVEFQINHIATAAVAVACVYWPALSPVLYKLLAKSKTAALGAMSVLAPIVRYAYA